MTAGHSRDMRVGIVGAGRMGADHIRRIGHDILRARVGAVVDVDRERAEAAAADVGGAPVFGSVAEMLEAQAVDAVILATPGFLHEEDLGRLLAAGVPTLCEKPLTPDAESALRVVQAEVAVGRQLIQVGFMRRFDTGYQQLRQLITSGEHGRLLMLHHQHRNPVPPPGFTDEMIIQDSVVHEFDAIRYFTGEEIVDVDVRMGLPSSRAVEGLHDPQLVTVQTSSGILATVEIFVSAQLGYQVHTQASFEAASVRIGESSTLQLTAGGRAGSAVDESFVPRFREAYDREVQRWVDAARRGEIDGPSAWDGYAAAACCEAGVESQRTGVRVTVELAETPDLYT